MGNNPGQGCTTAGAINSIRTQAACVALVSDGYIEHPVSGLLNISQFSIPFDRKTKITLQVIAQIFSVSF